MQFDNKSIRHALGSVDRKEWLHSFHSTIQNKLRNVNGYDCVRCFITKNIFAYTLLTYCTKPIMIIWPTLLNVRKMRPS